MQTDTDASENDDLRSPVPAARLATIRIPGEGLLRAIATLARPVAPGLIQGLQVDQHQNRAQRFAVVHDRLEQSDVSDTVRQAFAQRRQGRWRPLAADQVKGKQGTLPVIDGCGMHIRRILSALIRYSPWLSARTDAMQHSRLSRQARDRERGLRSGRRLRRVGGMVGISMG